MYTAAPCSMCTAAPFGASARHVHPHTRAACGRLLPPCFGRLCEHKDFQFLVHICCRLMEIINGSKFSLNKFKIRKLLTTFLDPNIRGNFVSTSYIVSYETSDSSEGQQPSLQVQAIIRELKKTFREELEPIHDKLERLEGSQTNTPEEDHTENGLDQTPNQRQNPRQGRVQQVDDNFLLT
ncbi:hypothetical protein V6N13_098921 [Hibiscus sabdariffa]